VTLLCITLQPNNKWQYFLQIVETIPQFTVHKIISNFIDVLVCNVEGNMCNANCKDLLKVSLNWAQEV
jgi:hypothetical protein